MSAAGNALTGPLLAAGTEIGDRPVMAKTTAEIISDAEEFSFEAYDQIARPLKIRLRSGKILKAVYFENFQSDKNLDALDAKIKESGDDGSTLNAVHRDLARHLSFALKSIPVMCDGAIMDDTTPDTRYVILRKFSYADLQLIMQQITQDLGRPIDGTTDSA